MNNPSLRVHTPQGESGSVLMSADDYLFRYSDKALADSAAAPPDAKRRHRVFDADACPHRRFPARARPVAGPGW